MCERHYRRFKKHGSTDAPALIDNLTRYEVLDNGCWHWTGPTYPVGYGKTSAMVNDTRAAHRAFYIEHVGAIPDGMDLDHLCHNADPSCPGGPTCPHRRCVNPVHMEPVSRLENFRRGRRGGWSARVAS